MFMKEFGMTLNGEKRIKNEISSVSSQIRTVRSVDDGLDEDH